MLLCINIKSHTHYIYIHMRICLEVNHIYYIYIWLLLCQSSPICPQMQISFSLNSGLRHGGWGPTARSRLGLPFELWALGRISWAADAVFGRTFQDFRIQFLVYSTEWIPFPRMATLTELTKFGQLCPLCLKLWNWFLDVCLHWKLSWNFGALEGVSWLQLA